MPEADLSVLDPSVVRELRTLSESAAEAVATLLAAAVSALADEDTEAAYGYARLAKKRASRVAVVREFVGVTAYRAGEFAEAAKELAASRRISGNDELVPMIADCERAAGRPERALDLIASVRDKGLPTPTRVEMRIVAAGARMDLGQAEAAVILLEGPGLKSESAEPWVARLRYAYADALLATGRVDQARAWFGRAAAADAEGETDADVRLMELEGLVVSEDEPVADADGEAVADADGEAELAVDADVEGEAEAGSEPGSEAAEDGP